MMRIPQDLIEEVLLRLPAEAVPRLSLVSKSWNTLINSPEFIRQHSSRSTSRSLVFDAYYLSDSMPHEICVASGLESPNTMKAAANLYYSLKDDKGRYVRVRGSCRGLIYLTLEEAVGIPPQCVLWNPCTHQIMKLPSPPVEDTWSGPLYNHAIGYDEGHDDYKVTRLARFYAHPSETFRKQIVEVYSLKSNRWRKLPDQNPRGYIESEECGQVNGALHWYNTRQHAIIALNLTTEDYHLISPPEADGCIVDCGVLGDSLIVWIYMPGDGVTMFAADMNMWIMKEYGVQDSWTKLNLQPPPTPVLLKSWKPVAASRDHKFIVFHNGCYLVRYDVAENQWCDDAVSIDIGSDFETGRLHAFIPSLVKLPGATTEASLLARRPGYEPSLLATTEAPLLARRSGYEASLLATTEAPLLARRPGYEAPLLATTEAPLLGQHSRFRKHFRFIFRFCSRCFTYLN